MQPFTYQLFAAEIRQKIRSGELKTGDTLDSYQALSDQYKLSVLDIRRGLALLQQEQLIVMHSGQNAYVAPAFIEHNLNSLQTLSQLMRKSGYNPEIEVYAFEWVETPAAAAEYFGISRDTESLLVTWRVSYHGDPIAYGETYFAPEAAQQITLADAEGGQIYKIIDSLPNMRLVRDEQHIRAVAARIDVAIMLELSEGSPLLKSERASRTIEGQVIALETAYYRADRYGFSITIDK